MSGSLPFRPHDDLDPDAREDGDNDDEEEDVDETVRPEFIPMISNLTVYRVTRRLKTLSCSQSRSANLC